MWPWLMIAAGVLLIVGGLVARHRMMRDYHAQLAAMEAEDTDSETTGSASADHERAEPVTTAELDARTETSDWPERSDRTLEVQLLDEPDTEPEPERQPDGPEPEPQPEPQPEPEPEREPAARPKPIIRIVEPLRDGPQTAPLPRVEAPAPRPASPLSAAPVARAVAPAAHVASPLPFPDRPATHLLTPPPMLRTRSSDIPLMDWLRYYSDGNAWSGVIQSISDRISGDPVLKPYFGSMDTATLQRHVMATVMELTGEGLTVGTVRRMADAHVQFVTTGGEPITEPVWDKLAMTFANALREHLVPESAVSALNDTVAPLKAVIVTRSSR